MQFANKITNQLRVISGDYERHLGSDEWFIHVKVLTDIPKCNEMES